MRLVFVTAYNQYAMEAWQTDAVGYVLKPYSPEDIRKQLERAVRYRPKPRKRVEIRTIPTLSILVDGKPLFLKRAKARELFALLVDRGESGVTSGESIACLWPDKPNSKETQSLFRMTYKRLADALEEEGLGELLISSGTRRALRTDQVDCDLYRILAGDEQTARLYDGQYLQEYSWAEDRNGQLYFMLHRDRV
jgi:two-component SAPR family response regulator